MDNFSPLSAGPCAGRRVLLVEDHEESGKGLAKLLRALRFEVTAVRDGASALEALASRTPPDFLLTDLQLPDLDGRELALRARELVPRPRVFLITGWDIDSTLEKLSDWGIECVMTKPLDIEALMGKLNQAPPEGNAPPSTGSEDAD